MPTAGPSTPPASAGSCELSVADSQGNWCQLLNTMASSGMPGIAIDGVPMAGTAADFGLDAMFSGFLTGKGRLTFITGSTLLLKEGRPWLGFGTPGTPHLTVPQVLANILEFGMDPYEARAAPRFWPLHENYSLEIEARVAPKMASGLAKMGIAMKPMQMNEFHMGSFQISWRDPKTGRSMQAPTPDVAAKRTESSIRTAPIRARVKRRQPHPHGWRLDAPANAITPMQAATRERAGVPSRRGPPAQPPQAPRRSARVSRRCQQRSQSAHPKGERDN